MNWHFGSTQKLRLNFGNLTQVFEKMGPRFIVWPIDVQRDFRNIGKMVVEKVYSFGVSEGCVSIDIGSCLVMQLQAELFTAQGIASCRFGKSTCIMVLALCMYIYNTICIMVLVPVQVVVVGWRYRLAAFWNLSNRFFLLHQCGCFHNFY